MWPALEQAAPDGLKSELQESWLNANQLHESSDAPRLTEIMHETFEEKRCRSLGLCLCRPGPDADAFHLHQKLVLLYKSFFVAQRKKKTESIEATGKGKKRKLKTSSRLLLEDGFLVLSLRPSASEEHEKQKAHEQMDQSDSFHGIGWSDVTAETETSPSNSLPSKTTLGAPAQLPLYFHVGFCNYTTYDFSVLALNPAGESEVDGRKLLVLTVQDRVDFLRAAHAFRQSVDFDSCWTARWHAIYSDDASQTPWDIIANKVEIDARSLLPELVVWKACLTKCC